MDNRPICVFDSGVGGLTAMRKLVDLLPNEDLIYFGDTGRVPYGGRSEATIRKYAEQDIRFLRTFSPKAILIACGTVSSHVDALAQPDGLPLVGVVSASAAKAAAATENSRVGIIGTRATIHAGAYERELKALLPKAEVLSLSCPLFVPLVENGRVRPGDIVIETVAEEYLEPFRSFGCDTLILGCTHYPLLIDVISDTLPGVRLIDSGAAAASALGRLLEASDLRASRTSAGQASYHVSDDPAGFSDAASLFMGRDIRAIPEKVDIETY